MNKNKFWQKTYLTSLKELLRRKMNAKNAHIEAVNIANRAIVEYNDIFLD